MNDLWPIFSFSVSSVRSVRSRQLLGNCSCITLLTYFHVGIQALFYLLRPCSRVRSVAIGFLVAALPRQALCG